MNSSSSSPGSLSANAEYLQQAYRAWKENPAETPPDLAHFFEGFEFAQAACETGAGPGDCNRQSAVDSLIYHYRAIGHRIAQINPLGDNLLSHPELELSHYGLSEEDLDRTFNSNHMPLYPAATLRQIIADLRETYCGYIGVEYMHIQETTERRWLQERMEGSKNRPAYNREQHLRALWKLKQAERFEHFLHTTYRGQKRFSLEGAETLIPALDHMVEQASVHGIVEIVFGMAHRGRLNVLANIIGKSYKEIFSEFEANFLPDTAWGDGDVKYHKGYSLDVQNSKNETIHLSLTANPSHLEMVGPVAQGKVRAKQALRGDKERRTVLPFLIHGDAAFAGQGVVAETLNLSQLKGYRVGGTIHFVINNQVGFTTTAQDYLSGLYCTDMAKMVAAPIFHVNGDHPEHVLHVMDIALEYRQKFQKDVVIDMWCYRRHGHNETDEPSFTQPLLYDRISKHETVDDLYAAELAERGESVEDEIEAAMARFEAQLDEAKKAAAEVPKRRETDFLADAVSAKDAAGFGTSSAPHDAGEMPLSSSDNGNGRHPLVPQTALGGYWKRLKREYSFKPVDTTVPLDVLQHIARTCASIPQGFDVNRKVRKLMDDFNAQVQSGPSGQLIWAQAEALAFGSLLMESHGVRLSGEDSRRGTFSQRHAVMYDQQTGDKFIPLMNLKEGQPEFCVYDSALAELSVLAFDYGYALTDPHKLIMWEAQFGDFANGAQVIIDQFIASGQSKWGRMSGIVLLLPHGYEGQGPEHSNAWIRRYLSMCAEDNIEVCYPTTPAQYFHLLRRQVLRDFRRPLVIFTPKSLLRTRAYSKVEDLTSGEFQHVIHDKRDIKTPRRVLFCAGKVYYDLMERAEAEGINDVAIVRVEQFYPISPEVWEEVETRYGGADEWVWVSEEPSNYGAWGFMHALLAMCHDNPVWYVGRARSASPAVGSTRMHEHQQKLIVDFALRPGPLEAELVDGVGAFSRGMELWHMKSRSPRLANR